MRVREKAKTSFAGGLLCISLLVPMLSACGEKEEPKGQVVATVNGQDVTRRELAAEPEAMNLPSGKEADKALAQILSGVINRKLVVAEAEKQKLNENPEYIADRQRAEETLLGQLLLKRWQNEIIAPTDAEVNAFIAANPQMFAQRTAILMDQLVAPSEGLDPKALEPLNTMDQVAAYFQSKGKDAKRGRSVVDSAKLPPALYAQMAKAPRGYPFAMVQGGSVQIVAMMETRPAPLPAAEAQKVAKAAIVQQKIGEKFAALRKSAKVEFAEGYAPPKPNAPAK